MGSIRAVSGGVAPAGPLTPGISRKVTDVDEHVSINEARIGPHTMSGWHHHGDHTGCVYVVHGQARVEWGPGGRESLEVSGGDFYIVSPNTIHRDGNPGSEEQTLVAFLVGSGPTFVNVEGPDPG